MQLKNKIYTAEGSATVAGLVFGVITHCFCLVNVLQNCDNICYQPTGYGFGVTSGRWLLSLMGDFMTWLNGNYNLPVVNGLLFLLLLAVSAGFLVSAFGVKNKVIAAVIGMLFVSFPSVTSMLAYRFTSVYYGWGILFAVLAVWVVNRCKCSFMVSALFTALSLGLYQAFTPITISVMVLLLIQQVLKGKSSFWDIVKRGLYYCASLILGLILYYVCLKVTLAAYGVELADYRGIDSMGQMSLRELLALVYEAFYKTCMMPLRDYHGIASTGVLKISYLLLAGITVIEIAVLLVRIKKLSITLITGMMCLLLPVAVNFIVVMVPDGQIYTLMLYGFVVLGCVPLVLLDEILAENCVVEKMKKALSNAVVIVSMVLVLSNSYQANVNYTALYYANCQVENYLNSLVTQIRMTNGFNTEQKWAFIGDIDDPLLHSYWQYEITYGGFDFTRELLRFWSMPDWIRDYCGYVVPAADEAVVEALSQTEIVKSMPCWPNDGSIQIIEDIIVVKFENVTS